MIEGHTDSRQLLLLQSWKIMQIHSVETHTLFQFSTYPPSLAIFQNSPNPPTHKSIIALGYWQACFAHDTITCNNKSRTCYNDTDKGTNKTKYIFFSFVLLCRISYYHKDCSHFLSSFLSYFPRFFFCGRYF